MATISIGGFGFGKHFKLLEQAVNSPQTMDSDTIVIKKKHLLVMQPAVINKTLYINGGGAIINVKQGQTAFSLNNGDLHLSNATFMVSPQANAMLINANYTGSVYLDNVTMLHVKCKLRETYPSFRINAPSQGQPTAHVQLKNCRIDYIDGQVNSIDLQDSSLGNFYRSPSNLIAYNFSARNLTLANTYISNANHAEVDSLTTPGQVVLNGHFKFNNVKIIDSGIDQGSGKVTEDYYKVQKLIDEAVKNQIANKEDTIFNIFGDDKFQSEVRIANVEIDHRKPFYQRQLISSKFSNLIIADSNLPELELPSSLANCTLNLDHVTDKSLWSTDHVSVSNRESTSSLFIKTRKVNGIQSVNGALTSTDDLMQKGGALAKLDGMIGLKGPKEDVHKLIRAAITDHERAKRGLKTKPPRLHTVLAGNQGTGKTVTARLMGQALYENGVLATNKFNFVHVTDLIGEYNGQTRPKTQQVVRDSLDGVLFIDEAYGLAHQANSNDNYGDQAVEELLQDMENYPGRLVVFMAGYTQNMQNFFKTSNPGLSSRFPNWINFPDYTPKEMLEILQYHLNQDEWHLADVQTAKLLRDEFLKAIKPGSNVVGNGRFCRTVVDKISDQAKDRMAGAGIANLTDQELSTITYDDVAKGMREVIEQTTNMHGLPGMG